MLLLRIAELLQAAAGSHRELGERTDDSGEALSHYIAAMVLFDVSGAIAKALKQEMGAS